MLETIDIKFPKVTAEIIMEMEDEWRDLSANNAPSSIQNEALHDLMSLCYTQLIKELDKYDKCRK